MSNERGEYGITRVDQPAKTSSQLHIKANLGIIGVGVALGVVGWPSMRKRHPFGVLALGAAGSMIAAGLISIFPERLWYASSETRG